MTSKHSSWFAPTLLAVAVATLSGCSGDDGRDGAAGVDGVDGANGAGQVVTLQRVGRTESRGFATSAAEIVAFDATGDRIFTVNAETGEVDVFSAADVTAPALLESLNLGSLLVTSGDIADASEVGAVNSIAIHGDIAAVAVEANPKTEAGWVVFLRVSDLAFLEAVQVGALPDMLTFTPDGTKVVVAIEGEPEDYTVDPEGRVDIITVADYALQSATFTDFNVGGSRADELPDAVRIYGRIVDTDGEFVRNSTVAEDLEPEYVAISADSTTAYVSLQEANAIAVVNLNTATVSRIFALGFKNHLLPGNELDASDRDDQVNIRNWPVFGMYQPDSIATYQVNGVNYVVTANEGDSRADWGIEQTDGDEDLAGDPLNLNMEEFRIKDLTLDATAFPDAVSLQEDAQIGRLKVTGRLGDVDDDGDFDALYSYGARSFSIWNADTGEQVFDSGNDFERVTARKYGLDFNNGHDEQSGDGRSDDKGPEPEALTIGSLNGRTYAFIGMERMGGIFVYEISNPYAPEYVQYLNDRDMTKDPEVDEADAGDLGPEGFKFVSAAESPNGTPLLIVGNEVSGTTSIYTVNATLLQE